MLRKRGWKCCGGLQKHDDLPSRTAKEERRRTRKVIGKGSSAISLRRKRHGRPERRIWCVHPDLRRPSDAVQEWAAGALRARNDHMHCSWWGMDEVRNGKLVHTNLFGYSTHQLQLKRK
jgi:hypothetical protein